MKINPFSLLLAGGLLLVAACHKDEPSSTDCANGPKIPVSTSNSPVGAGMTVQLSAETIPGATYHWTGPGITGDIENLQNPSFPYSDAVVGEYHVTASVGGCTSGYYTVYVTTDKVVGKSSPVAKGETITLSASNIPNAKYKWFKVLKDTVLAGTYKVLDSILIDSVKQVHYITNAQFSDAGIYKVFATNSKGITTSDTALVKVHIAKPIFTVTKGDTLVVHTGDDINLVATNAEADPAYTIHYQSVYDHLDTTVASPGIIRTNASRKMSGPYTITATYKGYKTAPVTVYVDVKYSFTPCDKSVISIHLNDNNLGINHNLYFSNITVGGKQQCWCTNNLWYQSSSSGTPIADSTGDFSSLNSSFIPGQGKCPEGYHIATYEDWTTLQQYYSYQNIESMLKVTYTKKDSMPTFWTSTEFPPNRNQCWMAKFSKPNNVTNMQVILDNRTTGIHYARCVKD